MVVGGGTAGCAVSAKLAYSLGANNVTVLESSDVSQSRSCVAGIATNIFFHLETLLSTLMDSRWGWYENC